MKSMFIANSNENKPIDNAIKKQMKNKNNVYYNMYKLQLIRVFFRIYFFSSWH